MEEKVTTTKLRGKIEVERLFLINDEGVSIRSSGCIASRQGGEREFVYSDNYQGRNIEFTFKGHQSFWTEDSLKNRFEVYLGGRSKSLADFDFSQVSEQYIHKITKNITEALMQWPYHRGEIERGVRHAREVIIGLFKHSGPIEIISKSEGSK